jgi:Novel STAND NTPase 3
VYDLDSLGWLLYERLATDAVERELAVPASAWQGSSDEVREALWDGTVLRMVWRRGEAPWPEHSQVIVTNADEAHAPNGVRVLGRRWLSDALDRSGELRAAHPSALGGSPLPATSSSFDAVAARELARVFVPVVAHARTLEVLRHYRFAVLTGPPEMGKTAVARMVALALVTDGWEAHECTRPEEVWNAWADDRAQVFVADDAFGSTEYRPDAGERWAREMERLLRSLDDRHALIWTSRPAPLRAGLGRIHRERGAERFPQPAQVLVDAAALDRAEKALILFRHAKAAGASGTAAARLVREHGDAIVEDPHFTPERIRRFTAGRLFRLDTAHDAVEEVLRRELREPTEAMAASFPRSTASTARCSSRCWTARRRW